MNHGGPEPTLQAVADRLDHLVGDVATLTDKVSKIGEDMAKLTDKVGQMAHDLERLTENTNRYEQRFERLDGRLWTLSLWLVGTALSAIFAAVGVVLVRSIAG
ncbi:MAG: hypothetical protein HC918_10150 [Oscillatoriales cyanobacterium SM2_1_8]|nr:hypothetical protein [Oscillatoriales cyanobacterium SM2_1_8]